MQNLIISLLIFFLVACGSEQTSVSNASDAVDVYPLLRTSSGVTIQDGYEGWVKSSNGNKVYFRLSNKPDAPRFPVVIIIPGGMMSGATSPELPVYAKIAKEGMMVAGFNPQGRGSGRQGDEISGGSDDCQGHAHQDDLKAVIEYLSSRPDVESIGVLSNSLGLAIAAGTLGRYPDLPVDFLIDIEGPHDNRAITFYDKGQEKDVCGHYSLITDPSPENEVWWSEREPIRFINRFKGRYLRIQAEFDHAQGLGYFRHAIEMINAATTGDAKWTRINGLDNQESIVYTDNQPRWIPGKESDWPMLRQDFVMEMINKGRIK